MNRILFGIVTLGLVLIVFLSSMIFVVNQTEKAIILRLGKLQLEADNKPKVYKPGLHFKLPLIEEVKNFDTRIHMLDIKSSRITTKEKKDVLVDFYVQWRIENLDLFYRRNEGKEYKAMALLEQKVVAGLKAEFGLRTIKEVVSGERAELMEKLRQSADNEAEHIGLAVIDVRIKRIDLPDEVSESVYARMRAERERAASEIRSEGRAEAIVIRAEADKAKRILLAEAERDAKKIHGDGDAAALTIYAGAYTKDERFFKFYRSLEAYRNTFNDKNDVLVIKPEGDFFNYFNKVLE